MDTINSMKKTLGRCGGLLERSSLRDWLWKKSPVVVLDWMRKGESFAML